MGSIAREKHKNFYFNDDMQELFTRVQMELGGVSNAQVLKFIFQEYQEHENCRGKIFHEKEPEQEMTTADIQVPDIPAEITRPDKVVTWLEDLGKQINQLSPKEAEKGLMQMTRSRREPTKAINAKSLYSPNSYHHFLKEGFQYREPPLNMLWNIIQFYIKSCFAARASGIDVTQMNAEFLRNHMDTGKADMNEIDPFETRVAKHERQSMRRGIFLE